MKKLVKIFSGTLRCFITARDCTRALATRHLQNLGKRVRKDRSQYKERWWLALDSLDQPKPLVWVGDAIEGHRRLTNKSGE